MDILAFYWLILILLYNLNNGLEILLILIFSYSPNLDYSLSTLLKFNLIYEYGEFIINKGLNKLIRSYIIYENLFEYNRPRFHLVLYEILLNINILYTRVKVRVLY